MKIRKFFTLFLSICIVFLIFTLCIRVDASTSNVELHTKTKVYSSNNSDYYSGCEDYDDYRNLLPTITVLTHGLDGHYYHWSNNYATTGHEYFAYNSDSIVEQLYQHLNGNMNIYIARTDSIITYNHLNTEIENCVYDGYKLYKISYNDYKYNPTNIIEVDYLDDVSKHILLLFDSLNSGSTHEIVYEQFHDVLDNISFQYKTLTGKLPRFNLVGHSRGGIINLMYATEHIYNVDSIYSMGTPYSGSALGLIDPVMEMLDYYVSDSNGNTYTNPLYAGVDDIMDEQISIDLRDAWNAAFTSDAKVNVVVYGSMTSIDFIRKLINEMAADTTHTEDYYLQVKKYQDLLNIVINVVDEHPDLISQIIRFANDLALIEGKFGIDLYDAFFTGIDSSLEGDITSDEVEQVLSLFNVIDKRYVVDDEDVDDDEGEIITVIMDDLFIDTDSQLGYGFSDGGSYNGFKRYVKIFKESDYSTNCAVPTQPAIPHNLETMCDTYVDDIVNSIAHGIPTADIYTLEDDTPNTYYFSNSKAFEFISTCEGERERTIIASGCQIDVYYYESSGMLKKDVSGFATLTNEFQPNVTYLIIITRTTPGNTTVYCVLENIVTFGEELTINDTRLVLSSQELEIILKVTQTGTYRFKFPNLNTINITLYDSYGNQKNSNTVLDGTDNMKCFGAYLISGTYYLKINNTSSNSSENITYQIEKHEHSYTYVSLDTENKHLASCSTCGYETVLSHVYDTHICIHCGEGTSLHDYDYNYVWVDYRSHSACCECGKTLPTLQPHAISSGSYKAGQKYAICLLCGGFAEMGFIQLNINSSSVNNVTLNGSFILPNGVIVLQDEDIEAYLNGTLVFYNKNEVPVIQ